MNTNKLGIDNEIFNSMRAKLNDTLQNIFIEMAQRSTEDASITLKLDIFKREVCVPNANTFTSNGTMTVDALKISYKVTSTIQTKSESKGTTPDGYMVGYDEINECFYSKKIEDAQMSMFEEE